MNDSTRRRIAIGSIIGTWALGAAVFAVLLLLQGPTPAIAMSTGTAALVAATTAGVVAVRCVGNVR